MIVGKIANSHNDEYYTPEYAITPLLNYLKQNSKIWCPFDKNESLFVKVFRENGFYTVATHIDNGQDFFKFEYKNCDYIISNPPYSKKTEVLQRLFEIGKPFAMLVGVVGLFDSIEKAEMFRQNEFEILYLNPRVKYFTANGEKANPPYQSAYVCHKILPKQIMFEKIDIKRRR